MIRLERNSGARPQFGHQPAAPNPAMRELLSWAAGCWTQRLEVAACLHEPERAPGIIWSGWAGELIP